MVGDIPRTPLCYDVMSQDCSAFNTISISLAEFPNDLKSLNVILICSLTIL